MQANIRFARILQLNSVKLVLSLALFLLGAGQSTTDQPYELKGEAPGITLKQFKANHKHVACTNRGAHEIDCRVHDRVSFAGVNSLSDKFCMVAGCDGQGISASFVDSRLTSLTYGLGPGGASTVIETLKSKFGKPTEINETGTSATWRNSIGHLDVSEVSLPSGDGHRRYIQTSVVSALNDRGLNKDI
jgi:hypothetical protein